MTTEQTYWNGNGKYQNAYKALAALIPAQGPVLDAKANPALERLRKFANAYYDVFNNGGCNYGIGLQAYFPGIRKHLRRGHRNWAAAHLITTPKLDAVILAAALEQGIAVDAQA